MRGWGAANMHRRASGIINNSIEGFSKPQLIVEMSMARALIRGMGKGSRGDREQCGADSRG